MMLGNVPAWAHHEGCRHESCAVVVAQPESGHCAASSEAAERRAAKYPAAKRHAHADSHHCCSHSVQASSIADGGWNAADDLAHDSAHCAACLSAIHGLTASIEAPVAMAVSDVTAVSEVIVQPVVGTLATDRPHLRGPPALAS